MYISNNSPTFCANLNSPKLNFSRKDFFIRIRGYGKNENWADEVVKTADLATNLIRRETSAENVLKLITKGVFQANQNELGLEKRAKTGILRTQRDGWKCDDGSQILTAYESGRYKCYADRFDEIYEKPLQAPNKEIAMSRPTMYQDILHGDYRLINSSLNQVFKLCGELFPRFVKKDITKESLPEFNSKIAEIRWILAHATPWQRGSDAISNVFMRAMYKAVGIKTYPLKKDISLDLEAYCTELKDYKNRFPYYFEKPPIIVE